MRSIRFGKTESQGMRIGRARLVAAALSAALALGGCAHGLTGVGGTSGVSPAPAVPWTPPEGLREKAERAAARDARRKAPDIPPEMLAPGHRWTLGDVVDLALRNSVQTRASWESARAAAAEYAGRRGDWFPDLNASASYNRQKALASGGREQSEQRTYGSGLDASWLLFNFGGRRASIEESRQALFAADWTHNATIQGVILEVERAYFHHTTALALLAAQEASLREARKSLDAAEARHDAGLGTIADVLQARTAMAQAQLALDRTRGDVETTRGVLATAMGLPANRPFEVVIEEGPPPAAETLDAVERYLERAARERPDLAAARAQAAEASAHVRTVKAAGYPAITASGSAGRTFYDSPDDFQDSYSASVQMRLPLFTGFSHHYDVRRAEAEARLARDRLIAVEQSVVLDVWTSYYDLKTAEQRLRTSDDLMRSATESREVAAGRYQAGVGGILDLLSAQAALEDARAAQVGARADWYLALAQLAHDTGTLDPARAVSNSMRAPSIAPVPQNEER